MGFEAPKADQLIAFVRTIYGDGFIPLHRPVFQGNEKRYLSECIDSNFVSSAGQRVTDFEDGIARFTGSRFAVAVVNGTAALHAAFLLAGVKPGDEIITQPLTFIATCNAASYAGARPVFVDVDRDTMGLSPAALRRWLENHAQVRQGALYNRRSGARIAACAPMHTFGLPCRIEEIEAICLEFGLALIEDAAESLGSWAGDVHTGRFGLMATLSFNGNKVITTGGGGMILTDDPDLARRAKHLTTTAKAPHPYEFVHDEIGFNYRLPNLNAALGCAQLEALPAMLEIKAEVASCYRAFCAAEGIAMVEPLAGCRSNHWLIALVLGSLHERNAFLEQTNAAGVMTRPVWRLMSSLEMFRDCENDGLANALWLEERVVNVPSSVPDKEFGRLRV